MKINGTNKNKEDDKTIKLLHFKAVESICSIFYKKVLGLC